jgi:hypothetical protein
MSVADIDKNIDDGLKLDFWQTVLVSSYNCEFESREGVICRLQELAKWVSDFRAEYPWFFGSGGCDQKQCAPSLAARYDFPMSAIDGLLNLMVPALVADPTTIPPPRLPPLPPVALLLQSIVPNPDAPFLRLVTTSTKTFQERLAARARLVQGEFDAKSSPASPARGPEGMPP